VDAAVTLKPPAPIMPTHAVESFDCGVPSLDDWLKSRAFDNHLAGAGRTFVVCKDSRVVAYYSVALGLFGPPPPVPMAVLSRLAVDRRFQAQGLARALVRDAVLRLVAASEAIEVRGLIARTITGEAAEFYLHLGFERCPVDDRSLILPLADVVANL